MSGSTAVRKSSRDLPEKYSVEKFKPLFLFTHINVLGDREDDLFWFCRLLLVVHM